MGISLVGSAGVNWPGANTTSQTVSYSSTTGSTLILAFGFDNSAANPTGLTITDSASNTWQYATVTDGNPPFAQIDFPGVNFAGTFIAYCIGATAITSVTLSATNGKEWQGVLSEWTGINGLEQSAIVINSTAGGSGLLSPSVSPANSGDLIITHAMAGGGLTATNGSNLGFDGDNTRYVLPGSTAPWTFSWNNSGTGFACAVAVFSAGLPVLTSPSGHVSAFGAKGDGKVLYDAAMTASSATLTSASGPFTAADVGKHIVVNNALGTTSAPLSTTISSFTSTTSVTLAASATSTISGGYACYGTDDTTAIRNCITAVTSYATSHGWYGEVLFDDKIYMVSGSLVQGGSTKGNAQIPLPVYQSDSANPTLVLAFTGVKGAAGPPMFTGPSDPAPGPDWSGTVLFSTLTGQSYSGTYGPPSMLGGPTSEQGYSGGFTDNWNNVMPVVQGITCMAPVLPTVTMMDFRASGRMLMPWARSAVFDTLGGIHAHGSPATQGPAGLVCPQGGNNAYTHIQSFTAVGFGTGMQANESVMGDFISTYFCDTGIYYNTHDDGHGCSISRYSAAGNNTHIFVPNSSDLAVLNILSMECENDSEWTSGYFIDDAGSKCGGHVNVSDNTLTGPSVVDVNGAANLEIIYQGHASSRGAQTAPSVPATTVALRNPFWRNASVIVTGGVVTDITVDGTSTGLTSGPVWVPSGKSITLTYTTAPSWNWWLQ